jgi:2-polyprenyl-3-methyl-5-hydroxy-6-metoxy-1,4-benzoquinol methylase
MPVRDNINRLYENYWTHEAESVSHSSSKRKSVQILESALLAAGFGYPDQFHRLWASSLARFIMRRQIFRDRVGSSISWLDGSWRGRLIDIGCGNGAFLARMRALGWDVVGVEPDPGAARIGRERYGLTIHPGGLEEGHFGSDSFDAVTMGHVIEHLADPLSTLECVRDALKRGGHLVIHTPNLSSLGHRWFRKDWRGLEPPRHLFIFRPQTLRKIVEVAGFTVLDLKTTFLDSIWSASRACKKGLDPTAIPSTYVAACQHLFMIIEHLSMSWPFHCPSGEQLSLIAVKP